MTKGEQKEYNHKYYLENKGKINECRAKRRDKINEYSRKYYSQKKQRLADLQKEVIALRRDKEDLIFVRNAKADHILELKEQIVDIKANCDLAIEGRDVKILELEKQIEKMKCCFNCKHSRTEYEHCRTDKHEKWEIKEK